MISKSISIFCDTPEKIENYQEAINDTTEVWDLHHRLELTLDGEPALRRADLQRMGMYYHRPYFELIFLKKKDHYNLHSAGHKNPMYGHKQTPEAIERTRKANLGRKDTPETIEKKRIASTGENNGFYGKHHTAEKRAYWSQIRKGRPNPNKGKSNRFKGMKWKLVDGKRIWYKEDAC